MNRLRIPVGLLLLLVCAPALARAGTGPDIPPRRDLDRPEAAKEPLAEPSQLRWLFRPHEPSAAMSRLVAGAGERVAVLDRLDGLWILEAPADSAARLVEELSPLGELRADRGGRPALLETTALVGVRDAVWRGLDLRGDPVSSVAILDSGCDTAHDDLGDPDSDNADTAPEAGDADDWVDAAVAGFSPDFDVKVVGWHDVTDDMPSARGPYDYHFHGTAVASAGFGQGRLDPDGRGVAPEGRLVVVKTWNFEDRWELWASDLLLGLDWVLDHRETYRIRACLVPATWDEDLEISAAVELLLDVGIVVIAAAGNDAGGEMGWPARVPDVIAVGATNSAGLVASYSTPAPAGTDLLDLLAPGGSELDLGDAVVVADNEPNDTYRGRVGTSLAAAHVAGTVSLLSQALSESGRAWHSDRSQVRWVQDVIRYTTVETAGAEVGAPGVPRLDRLKADRIEGWGLLQAHAAVDAARNVIWPGERVVFSLGDPIEGRGTWAGRMPVLADRELILDLLVPVDGDFDLLVYHEREGGLELVGWSSRAGVGISESVHLDRPREGTYVIVARRLLGAGEATLVTEQRFAGDVRWPLALSSVARSAPTVYDLDGDGSDEVIVVNDLAVDATGHRFHVFRPDGSDFGAFPRTYFSGPARPGPLTAPAVGRVGERILIVSGGAFGQAFAVDGQAQLAWTRIVSDASATSAPTIWEEGPDARVLIGTGSGIVVLDPQGALSDTLLAGSSLRTDLAVGDVDADGREEIAAIDNTGRLHLLEIDGSALPGWPLSIGSVANPLPPLLVGDSDGSGARLVVHARVDAAGGAVLHARTRDASSVAGFPHELSVQPGGRIESVSPPVASPLERGGEVYLLLTSVQRGADGGRFLRLHRIALDASELPPVDRPFARPGMTGTQFGLQRPTLTSLAVGELTSLGDLDLLMELEVGWIESEISVARRYGSLHRTFVLTHDTVDPRVDLELDGGHRFITDPIAVPPVLADLDGDLRTDVLVTRGRQIHVISSRLPAHVEEVWRLQRGDAARRACFGCGEAVVVDAPSPGTTLLGLRAAPNPFNPRTVLELSLPEGGTVRWSVYDVRGRLVQRWIRRLDGAGTFREVLQAEDERGRPLASGVYFVEASTAQAQVRTRVTLVR